MPKHLLYLSDWEMHAYLYDKEGLSPVRDFYDSPAGRAAFGRYLEEHAGLPTYLLVDLSEENFQQETLPHVMPKARRAMIERRLGQLYRDTPYRRAEVTGRQADGRKDDYILFSALTNPAATSGWLRVLQDKRVPLAGMYSLALMGKLLRKGLRLPATPLLLITHQSSGIRQSYFEHGHLVFSRLAPWYDNGLEGFADTVLHDVEQTREYLATARLLAREERLDVAVVAARACLAPLQARCKDTTEAQYRLIDIAEAAGTLGLGKSVLPTVCDTLFVALLAGQPPARHYETFEQNRIYDMLRWRLALQALAGGTVAVGLAWAGLNADASWHHYRRIEALNAETTRITLDYNAVLRSMPRTEVSARDMKAAVEIGKMLRQNVTSMEPALTHLSRALAAIPGLTIDQLHWKLRAPHATAATDPSGQPQVNAATLGVPHPSDQVVTIEGKVLPFAGDYRAALAEVDRLVDLLEQHPRHDIKVTRLPIDISPMATLAGQASATPTDQPAVFAIELVWKP
ncbi:hypothetical protein [Massilia sp. MS-15]|uniref:hypothetical protein n=1 Tax=Massilia sp. MS-15 TaxID=2878200 RepID=UPI001CD1DAC6|nr:hypothetical protein [Massilia sp. MS-15]MCA1248440.1 hypothetical protein [Massilia sp. MS-15]